MAIEWGPIISSGISAAAGLASTAAQGNLNKKNRKWQEEQAAIQREYSTEMMNAQNAWNMEMWQKENEYNSPEAQVQRLRDAGLNPLYYGLDGSSANALESAQPLGYERAESNFQTNPVSAGINAFVQTKGLENSTKLINAQVDKLKEDTKSVGLDNEWKDKTMQARIDSENLKNEVLRSDVRLKKQDLKNKVQELDKLIAETDNEVARHGYIIAQTALQEAMKKKTDEETATIIALRPFDIQLKEAQTDAQKASAAAQYANALYTNGLVDAGYIDKQIDVLVSQSKYNDQLSKSQEAQRYITEYKNAIKAGNVNDFLRDGQPRRGWLGQALADIGSGFFQFMSIAGDVIGTVPGVSTAFSAALGGSIGSSVGAASHGADASVVAKQTAALASN